MKLSTLRTAGICALFFAARLSASQAVALTLSSVESQTDNTVQLKLLLKASSSSAPAGLQWTFRIPPGLDIQRIEAGEASKAAAKTLICNGAKCIIYGLNRTTIPNGPIAVLEIKTNQTFAGQNRSAQSTKKQKIQIGDVVAVSSDGKAIPVAPALRPGRFVEVR